ncbi:hypothetical protein ALC53_12597 [Atta colombica]|uniref:Uncharacterized protein n=1 Tax=Atta colombica TaxID=520822 RepID=A0A151HYX0_9HYME|nr:hypothetical protein ALC53_12597 [Atta colombica]
MGLLGWGCLERERSGTIEISHQRKEGEKRRVLLCGRRAVLIFEDTRGHDKVIEDWRIKVLVHVNHLDHEHRLGRQGRLTAIARDYRQLVLTVPDTLSTLKKPSLSIASDRKYSTSPPAPSSGSVASTTATTVHIGTSSRILTFAKVGALSLTSSTVTLTSASECKGGVSLLLSRARILSSYISCRSLSSLPKTLSTPVTGSTRKSLVSVTRESASVALARHTLVPFSAVSEILKLANDFSNLGALSLTSKIHLRGGFLRFAQIEYTYIQIILILPLAVQITDRVQVTGIRIDAKDGVAVTTRYDEDKLAIIIEVTITSAYLHENRAELERFIDSYLIRKIDELGRVHVLTVTTRY